MSVTSTAPIYPKLLRLITPQNPRICPSFLHLATEPPPLTEIPPPSVVAQVADILKTNDEESWKTNCQLNHLLFSNSSSLSSHYFLQITRQLGNSDTAFKFLQYLHSSSPSPEAASLSSTFQAICELAGREPNSQNKLLALLNTSKELNVPLTINCAISLIRLFGRAKMVNDSMLVYNELDQSLRNTHVRNVLIDVLLRCGQLDNALKVLDEMLQTAAEFPPNGNTGNIVFSGLLKFEKYERSVKEEEIVELVSKFGNYSVFPDSMRLTQLITKFCRHRKSERAWDLLHVVMESGGPVEVPSFNALLAGLGRVAEVEKMNLLMKEMKEKGIIPNVVTFGIVINHLCKSRRLDQAQEVLEKMRDGEDGVSVKPDVIIYNTLIDGLCKIGRQEEGLTLIDRMRSDDHCEPNTITYNCLIDGFCKAGELDRAHELFIAMNGSGVQPNIITINSLVDGMCRHGRISSAIEFFNKMKDKGLEGNEVTYTTLISAFCNVNNINKALDLFHEMREKCRPDAIVYFTLISGLSQAGQVDEASSIASQMKKDGFVPDIGCYNVLISGFCKKNKQEKAYQLLKEMETAGVRPDGITYNTLISHFSKMGDFKTAHRVLRSMLKDGLVPTVVTYGALIHAYCLVGYLEEAMKVFREMSSASRVPPNTVIYNTLIDSLCKNKKVDTALSLFDDMIVKAVRPNANTFNSLFKGLQDMNSLDKAFELMDRMTEQACNPDYITMEILTQWLSAVGDTDKLQKFVQGYKVSATMV